jgi:hypothetical protein
MPCRRAVASCMIFLYVRLRLLVVESRSAIREIELGKMTGFAPQTHVAAGHGQGCGVAPLSQQHIERSVRSHAPLYLHVVDTYVMSIN